MVTCSHDIKRRLLVGRKAMANLDSILNHRDIIFPTKVHLVKAMVFPVVMYDCESWTIKKVECLRIDAFGLWCWRRFLREREQGDPKLKLQYFGHLMWRTDSLEKRPWCWERLKAGGEGDDRGWDGWMASPTQWAWVWIGSRSWWWTGKPGMLQSMELLRVRHDWATSLSLFTFMH